MRSRSRSVDRSAQSDASLGGPQGCREPGALARLHFRLDPELRQQSGHAGEARVLDLERSKLAAFRRVLRWMQRIGSPLDEERDRLDARRAEFVHHAEGLPPEKLPVRTRAGALLRPEGLGAGI